MDRFWKRTSALLISFVLVVLAPGSAFYQAAAALRSDASMRKGSDRERIAGQRSLAGLAAIEAPLEEIAPSIPELTNAAQADAPGPQAPMIAEQAGFPTPVPGMTAANAAVERDALPRRAARVFALINETVRPWRIPSPVALADASSAHPPKAKAPLLRPSTDRRPTHVFLGSLSLSAAASPAAAAAGSLLPGPSDNALPILILSALLALSRVDFSLARAGSRDLAAFILISAMALGIASRFGAAAAMFLQLATAAVIILFIVLRQDAHARADIRQDDRELRQKRRELRQLFDDIVNSRAAAEPAAAEFPDAARSYEAHGRAMARFLRLVKTSPTDQALAAAPSAALKQAATVIASPRGFRNSAVLIGPREAGRAVAGGLAATVEAMKGPRLLELRLEELLEEKEPLRALALTLEAFALFDRPGLKRSSDVVLLVDPGKALKSQTGWPVLEALQEGWLDKKLSLVLLMTPSESQAFRTRDGTFHRRLVPLTVGGD